MALLAVGALGIFASATPAATAPATLCARLGHDNPGSPTVELDMPSQIAQGNASAIIWANQNPKGSDNGANADSLTTTVTDEKTNKVIATFNPKRIPRSTINDLDVGTFVPNQPLGTVDEITLTYNTPSYNYDAATNGPACEQRVSRRVTITRGMPPTISLGSDNYGDLVIVFDPPLNDCASQIGGWTDKKEQPLTETWSSGSTVKTWHLTPCYVPVPKMPDGQLLPLLPGLQFENNTRGEVGFGGDVESDGYEIDVANNIDCTPTPPNPCSSTASAHLTITFGDKTLLSRTIVAYTWYQPAYRVWQGTDAFVNYCINGGHQTYSSNLQLYCNHPSKVVSWVHAK